MFGLRSRRRSFGRQMRFVFGQLFGRGLKEFWARVEFPAEGQHGDDADDQIKARKTAEDCFGMRFPEDRDDKKCQHDEAHADEEQASDREQNEVLHPFALFFEFARDDFQARADDFQRGGERGPNRIHHAERRPAVLSGGRGARGWARSGSGGCGSG